MSLEDQLSSARRQRLALHDAYHQYHLAEDWHTLKIWDQTIDYILTRIMERDYAKEHSGEAS